MQRIWYRHDRQGVVEALRRGEPIDMATSLSHTRLDELVAWHEELGVLEANGTPRRSRDCLPGTKR